MSLFSLKPKVTATDDSLSGEVNSEAAESVEQQQLRVRLLIEAAMQEARYADSDSLLIVRQLAAELVAMDAALSDVRLAVNELYQADTQGAADYLAYLAEQGYPPAPASTLAAQQQAAIESALPGGYGQLPAPMPGPHLEEGTPPSLQVPFYGGNLVSELVANSAFSALILGERRSGTSAILRAICYDQIAKASGILLDIVDLHNGQWGGLEDIRFADGDQMVTFYQVSCHSDIEPIGRQLAAVAAEVKRRQRQQRQHPLTDQTPPAYLFLFDGLSELHGALPGWSHDRRSKDKLLSRCASHLRYVLCHGPGVGISCVATARTHDRALCDATALGETKLLFLGRVSAGRNGGYRAIDKAIEDRELLPSPAERSGYREQMSAVKRAALPVVFTPNGGARLGKLADFGRYLQADLLSLYQHVLEVNPS